MTRVQILLNEAQKKFLQREAKQRGNSISALVRNMVDQRMAQAREKEIARVAEDLSPLYESDNELTAFASLDSDDWHE